MYQNVSSGRHLQAVPPENLPGTLAETGISSSRDSPLSGSALP